MVLRGIPMSQIDLQKLTKKNQEFIHIATQQFIKDGKTLAAVAIEATAKMSLEGKDSPNQTIGKGVATIPEGANLQVTAISTDGVAEVSYEGQTVYVLTSGLS